MSGVKVNLVLALARGCTSVKRDGIYFQTSQSFRNVTDSDGSPRHRRQFCRILFRLAQCLNNPNISRAAAAAAQFVFACTLIISLHEITWWVYKADVGDDSAVLLLPRVPETYFTNVQKISAVTKAGDNTVAASHPSVFHCAVQTRSRKAVGR